MYAFLIVQKTTHIVQIRGVDKEVTAMMKRKESGEIAMKEREEDKHKRTAKNQEVASSADITEADQAVMGKILFKSIFKIQNKNTSKSISKYKIKCYFENIFLKILFENIFVPSSPILDFLLRDAMGKRSNSRRPLSVCLYCHTHCTYCIQTAKDIIEHFSLLVTPSIYFLSPSAVTQFQRKPCLRGGR